MKNLKSILPGILFALTISLISMSLSSVFSEYIKLESLTIAIVIGILYNNYIGTQVMFVPGVRFSLSNLLSIGIVLLGFRLDISVIWELGSNVLLLIVLYVPIIIFIYMGFSKLFKINKKLGALIGIGSSICGASAVVALAPCIGADDDDAIVAVSIVSILGAIGVIIYSIVANSILSITDVQYGMWSGLTLHGVAHSLAGAFARGTISGDVGTFVKMARVLMLVPVSVGMSYLFKNKNSDSHAKFPMYVFYFTIAGIINSLGIIPLDIARFLAKTSSILILISMTAMGLSVNFKQVAKKGTNSFIMGLTLFALSSVIALFLITLM
ncbi:MAG: hypothetical protein COA82_03265 [Alkaliphilus sp.]|nr:MAG: hypothetical protein COA82_03265 [Alkaliphilus sp.]